VPPGSVAGRRAGTSRVDVRGAARRLSLCRPYAWAERAKRKPAESSAPQVPLNGTLMRQRPVCRPYCPAHFSITARCRLWTQNLCRLSLPVRTGRLVAGSWTPRQVSRRSA